MHSVTLNATYQIDLDASWRLDDGQSLHGPSGLANSALHRPAGGQAYSQISGVARTYH